MLSTFSKFLFGKPKVYLAAMPLALALTVAVPATHGSAQTASAARPAPQRGTVKAIDGNNLTLTTDTGQQVVISVAPDARIQLLAPGSTDLKTAEPATLPDVAVGDRILATGTPGDTAGSFHAARVVLMKSGDIAQRHLAEQQEWQRHGTSGIVTSIDASNAISVASGNRKLQVIPTPTTAYRRYADGSVKFEDARPGTLADIHVGDQLLARGAKSEDGSSLQAEEIVSGSFRNLSGTISSIYPANNSVSLKDLVSKRSVTVHLTSSSALHRLPQGAAASFAARAHGGGGAGGSATPGPAAAATGSPATGSQAPGTPTRQPDRASGGTPDRASTRPAGAEHSGGGGDLSQVVARLPAIPLSDLHPGDAVMIVAEQSSSDTSSLTAITLLAGVEPILAAAPSGSAAMTLSPWSVATGAPEGGGASQ